MPNIINGETRLACLLGSPVSHSKSPALHNKWFSETEVNAVYLCFDTPAEQLENTVSAMRRLNVLGFNVTMPDKTLIIPLLDEVYTDAAMIGAVNTVVNKDGRLIGYNTDGAGFVKSLDGSGVIYKGRNITAAGAGGAGRAVCTALALGGAGSISIFDINKQAAENLAATINGNTDTKAAAYAFDKYALLKSAARSDIFINCTAVGMRPNDGESIIHNPEIFNGDMAVCDCVYEPDPTKLLKEAAARGAKAVSGLGMLQNQAALAFKLFTGIDAPV